MKTLCLIISFLLLSLIGISQSNRDPDFVVNSLSLSKHPINFTKLKGIFKKESGIAKTEESDPFGNIEYHFTNNQVNLFYTQNNKDENCDYFTLFGTKVSMTGKFEPDELSCNLDVRSFEVFRFDFKNKKYLLIQSIRDASGTAASTILFHLFDITNMSEVKYFPAWSKYGSKNCFGDFNNDGKLDFVAIRDDSKNMGSGAYKATLSSIDYSSKEFLPMSLSNYISFRKTYNRKHEMVITVLKRKW